MEESMESQQYTPVAKALHWTMAIVIICAWAIGYYSSTLRQFPKLEHQTIMLHKSIATVTIFLLAARILWRLTHRPPETTAHLSSLERRAAIAGHLVLYVCMIALPATGWLWASVAGYPVPVAGLFFLPPLMAKAPELAPIFRQIHFCFAYAIACLVVGHALMALKHHFLDGNESLRSMLPLWVARRIGRGKRAGRSLTM
jgi:cytochrome b561